MAEMTGTDGCGSKSWELMGEIRNILEAYREVVIIGHARNPSWWKFLGGHTGVGGEMTISPIWKSHLNFP